MLKAFSILHIPPNGVEVTDGEVVSIRNSAGGDPHVGNAVVENGAITGVNITAATTCMVDDGDSANLTKADGSGFIGGTVTAAASVASGALTEFRLPGGETVLKDMQASIIINQFDGSAGVAANVHVTNNEPNLQLANAVTRIAVNLGPVQVTAGAKTVNANIAINQGAWEPFPLGATTDAIVSSGDALVVPVTGTYTSTATLTVANGAITGIVLS